MATLSDPYSPEKLSLTPQCVESQEWTYGIDNTGTRFNDVATYCFELSDGSTLEWSQDGSSGNWAQQLTEWAANIQLAADDAGLAWFVEPRFVDTNGDVTSLDGTIYGPGGTPSGLPGAPTVPIAEALDAGGIFWRYVNLQICPGQPVPTRAFRKTSQLYGDNIFELTAVGAILGPVKKFWLCVECDGKDSGELLWLKPDPDDPDNLIPAEAGEIPNCWEPCGTLALADAPPDRECEFFFAEACDNVGEPDDDTNWTNLVTRRATVCAGEQIAVSYFVPDPSPSSPEDAGVLVPYSLIGEFVDCDTGQVIELPEEECPIIGAQSHCALVGSGETITKKTGYQVSDFDSGDLNVGDAATCTFSVTVDDPAPTFVMTPVSGYSFSHTVSGNTGSFVASFIYDGSSNPQVPLQVTVTLSTGESAVISGGDFYLCSGGGESQATVFTSKPTKQQIKEICFEGKPSKWQDESGQPIELTEFEFCIDKQYYWARGYNCDLSSENYGDPVRWLEGETDGVPCYPDDAVCPTFYSDKIESGEDCTQPLDIQPESVCADIPEVIEQCVESQEWTYGIDNTGTRFDWDDAVYEIVLSDGSTLQFTQSTAAGGGWTPQMQEWGANIQAAADSKGLLWFVDTRYRIPSNPSSLAGGGGFSGPPSVAVSEQLTNMLWRYVNIQICPGQPVPVSASIVSHTGGNEAAGRALTTDGAVLGPLQKFWMCKACGQEPNWYLEDGVTEAEAGQIPNCWEPCGTISLVDAPPDRSCEFFFAEACDNVGEPDDDTNWTNLVTRRATVCSGEQIGVDYYIPDPADSTALIPYTLIGEFVDCDTGDVIELPPIECDNPQVKKIWRITSDGLNGINGQRWLANAADHGPTGGAFIDCKKHVNGAADETVVITNGWNVNDLDFPATGSDFATSQELYYAWIYLPKPAVLADNNGNTGEWLSAFVGGCGQKPKKVAEFGNTATAPLDDLGEFAELSAGLYQLVLQVSDFSVYGGLNILESQDGGATFSALPMSRTYVNQPEINCDCVAICDTLITELDGTVIDFDPDTMSWCEIKCPEVTVPDDLIPDYEFETTDGCDSVDGNSVNYVNITRETVFVNGTPTTRFFTMYGDDTQQAEYTLVGEFVNCATGEVIDEPEPPPCSSTSYAGLLWRVKDTASLLTTVDYWGGPNFPAGQASAPHGNVSDIFTVSANGRTLEHSVGPPSVTFAATFTDIRTSNANFIAATGAGSNTGTNGNDQIRVRGYVILNEPALLRDINPNTGERGGIWLNKCCAGSLELLFEDTTDSVSGDTGIFNNVRVPAGRHYFEAVTSDLSAWQGFQLDASYNDGASYSPLPIYDIKPEYECIALARCDDNGTLLHADTGEVITVGPNDLRCEPPACIADAAATSSSVNTLRIV